MESLLLRPELEIVGLVAIGFLAWWLLTLLFKGVGLLPLKRAHVAWIKRLQPLLMAVFAFAYLTFMLRILLRSQSTAQPLSFAALALAFGAAGWFAIRDFVAGVFLKLGKAFEPGDRVRIGDVEGRVERLGLRALTVETSRGEEALIPYSKASGNAVLRTSAIDGVARHVFELRAPEGSTLPIVRQTILEHGMTAHFASIVREPQVKPLGDQRYEVTVFALHGDYGPDIEARVRRAHLFS